MWGRRGGAFSVSAVICSVLYTLTVSHTVQVSKLIQLSMCLSLLNYLRLILCLAFVFLWIDHFKWNWILLCSVHVIHVHLLFSQHRYALVTRVQFFMAMTKTAMYWATRSTFRTTRHGVESVCTALSSSWWIGSISSTPGPSLCHSYRPPLTSSKTRLRRCVYHTKQQRRNRK